MMELLIFVAVGIALLLLVVRLVRGPSGGRGPDLAARQPAAPADLSAPLLPSRALLDRIFAAEDRTFVSQQGPRPVFKLFLQDRRRMALSWLKLTRRHAVHVIHLHLRSVRTNASLEPVVELKLAFHALLFFAVYVLLFGIIGVFGAFGPRGPVRNVVNLAQRLLALGGNILTDIDRSRIRVAESPGQA